MLEIEQYRDVYSDVKQEFQILWKPTREQEQGARHINNYPLYGTNGWQNGNHLLLIKGRLTSLTSFRKNSNNNRYAVLFCLLPSD